MASEDTIIARLGVTPEQFVGYAYAGLLLVLIAAVVEPTAVKEIVGTLGGFLSAIVGLALGIGVYTLYFRILGEFLLYPVHHLAHLALDRMRGKSGLQHSSCVAYLGALGVQVGQRRAAYQAVKAAFFPQSDRRRIQLLHGELHVLYLTAVETAAAAIYLLTKDRSSNVKAWFAFSAVCYIAGLLGDLHQHTLECYMLKAHPQRNVLSFLAEAGYVSQSRPNAHSETNIRKITTEKGINPAGQHTEE